MDKKSLALLIILVAVAIFYWPIVQWLGLVAPAKPAPSSVGSPVDSTMQVSADSLVGKRAPQRLDSSGAAVVIESATPDSLPPDTVVVRTKKFRVLLTTRGGGPISLVLSDYSHRDGRPVEMLPEALQATPEATFAGGTVSTSQMTFVSSLVKGEYDATITPLELTYTYRSATGGEIARKYRFHPDRYDYDLVVEIRNRDKLGFERQYNLVWNNPLGVTEPEPATDYDAMEAVAYMSGSREKLGDFKDNTLNQTLSGSTTWAGVRAKYFAAVIIPRSRTADAVFAQGTKRAIPGPPHEYVEQKITVGLDFSLASVTSLTDSFTVFVGPLDYSLMSHYNVGLEDIFDIGTTPFVGWIIKPFALAMIWLLPLLYSVVPNFGIVIILVALLVKLVTLPLSLKSFKSMNAMKELQPKIEEMRKKLKNNPQQLNSEMMKMYKAHGVNPMSGCLPMLAQMPLFFALFSVFRSTILLRGAHFVWFINDLSRGATSFTDPYISLVVIMIGFQYLSQKLTMASSQQNKMLMYLMPAMMGFLFYKFSSGLVLYWTCFSAFSLLDYFIFKRGQMKNPQVMAG